MMLSVARLIVLSGRMMDGFRRKWSWLNHGTIMAFAWGDGGKPRKTLVGLAGFPANI